MSPTWTPEIKLDPLTAGKWVEAQFPELSPVELRPLASGWDNEVFEARPDLYFRFPRRKVAVAGVEHEMGWLPRLRNAGLAVPELVYKGAPNASYPWPFFGYRPVQGSELGHSSLTEEARVRLARPLARFLKTLHSRELFREAAAENVPRDPLGRLDFSRRGAMTREIWGRLQARGEQEDWASLERVLGIAEKIPRPTELTALTHGDLHFRHVLVSGGRFAGVIDWGDLQLNDPAIDLSLVWTALPQAGQGEFLSEYGAVSEGQAALAKGLGVFLCSALWEYGLAEGMSEVVSEARAGLRRVQGAGSLAPDSASSSDRSPRSDSS